MESIQLSRQVVKDDSSLSAAIVDFCMSCVAQHPNLRVEWYKVKKNRMDIKVDCGPAHPAKFSHLPGHLWYRKRRDYLFLSYDFTMGGVSKMIPRNRGTEREISIVAVGKFIRVEGQVQVKVTRKPKWSTGVIYSSRRHSVVDPLMCDGCTMSNFKSAVSEAREGRASLQPSDWTEGILGICGHNVEVVDVFICNVFDCCQYGVCVLERKSGEVDLRMIWPHAVGLRMQEKRNPLLKHLESELGFSTGIGNLILDFVMPRPGQFPSARLSEVPEEITFPNNGIHPVDPDRVVFAGKEPTRVILSREEDREAILYRYLGGKEVGVTLVIRT